MKYKKFLISSVILMLAITCFGYQKDHSDQDSTSSNSSTTYSSVESIETGQSYWKMEIDKNDFVDLLDDAGFSQQEIDDLEPQLIDPIVYVPGINSGESERC